MTDLDKDFEDMTNEELISWIEDNDPIIDGHVSHTEVLARLEPMSREELLDEADWINYINTK